MMSPRTIEATATGFIIGRGENAVITDVVAVGNTAVLSVRNYRGSVYEVRIEENINEQTICHKMRALFDSIEWSYY